MSLQTLTLNGNDYPAYASPSEGDIFLAADPVRMEAWNEQTGKITGGEVAEGGTNYDPGARVDFVGGGGMDAAATLAVSSGVITGIDFTDFGIGYTSAPMAQVVSSSGSGARITVDFDPTNKKILLIASTRRMDLLRYKGTKTVATQRTQFPRNGLVYPDGTAVTSATVPLEAEYASILLAGTLASDPTHTALGITTTPGAREIESLQAGSVRIAFDTGIQARNARDAVEPTKTLSDPTAQEYISQWLVGKTGRSFGAPFVSGFREVVKPTDSLGALLTSPGSQLSERRVKELIEAAGHASDESLAELAARVDSFIPPAPPVPNLRYFGWSDGIVIDETFFANAAISLTYEALLPHQTVDAHIWFAVLEDEGYPAELYIDPNPTDQIVFYDQQAGVVGDMNGVPHIVGVSRSIQSAFFSGARIRLVLA